MLLVSSLLYSWWMLLSTKLNTLFFHIKSHPIKERLLMCTFWRRCWVFIHGNLTSFREKGLAKMPHMTVVMELLTGEQAPLLDDWQGWLLFDTCWINMWHTTAPFRNMSRFSAFSSCTWEYERNKGLALGCKQKHHCGKITFVALHASISSLDRGNNIH